MWGTGGSKGGTPGTSDKGWAEGTPTNDDEGGVLRSPDTVGAGTPWDCGRDEGTARSYWLLQVHQHTQETYQEKEGLQ
jgi:hypothetical protein